MYKVRELEMYFTIKEERDKFRKWLRNTDWKEVSFNNMIDAIDNKVEECGYSVVFKDFAYIDSLKRYRKTFDK